MNMKVDWKYLIRRLDWLVDAQENAPVFDGTVDIVFPANSPYSFVVVALNHKTLRLATVQLEGY